MKLQAELSKRVRWSLQHQSICRGTWFSCHLKWTPRVTVNISLQCFSDKDLHEEIKSYKISLEEIAFPLKKKTGVELVSS